MKSIVSICLASLVTSPVWSAVVVSGVVDFPIATTLDGIYLDLDSASAVPVDDDLDNSQVNFFFGGDGLLSNDRFLPARLGVQSSDPIRNLPVGTVVSDSLFFTSPEFGTSMMHIGNSAAGQFENGVEGYLGFKFDRLDDGDFTFGWMRVTLTNGSSEGMIHEWAYSDTPGELIVVGRTVIPESTSGMLFLLASGGMVFLRRRA